MTSISLLLAPWHLLASHLFSLLLIWHSHGRWWMCVWKPADKRLFSVCNLYAKKTLPWPLAIFRKIFTWSWMWRHLSTEREQWRQRGLFCERTCWYNVLYLTTWGKITTWRLTEFTSLLIRRLRPTAVFFDLHAISALSLFPLSHPFSLVFLGPPWKVAAMEMMWFVREPVTCHYSWVRSSEKQAFGLHMKQEEDEGRSQRSRVQSDQLPRLRPQLRDFWTALQEIYGACVCTLYLLYVSNVSQRYNRGQTPVMVYIRWICLNIRCCMSSRRDTNIAGLDSEYESC